MYDLNLFSDNNTPTTLPLKDAAITYYPHFFSKNESDYLFEVFFNETAWQQDHIKVFGKIYAQTRLTALYGLEGKSYSYSGIQMFPKPFTETLTTIKSKVESLTSVKFTTVLLNLYRDGTDSNGWHSDDEKELGENPIIASVSFGEERSFQLKHKKDKAQSYKLQLGHGSLLLMEGATQHHWKHQLPKTKKIIGPRINLTFRIIK